jgi:hypothetical protein
MPSPSDDEVVDASAMSAMTAATTKAMTTATTPSTTTESDKYEGTKEEPR